jgi:hypothetical protein
MSLNADLRRAAGAPNVTATAVAALTARAKRRKAARPDRKEKSDG